MLVIEGPDGSGKSTLIKQIRAEYEAPIAERVVNTDGQAMNNSASWVDQENAKGFQRRIFDRHRLISNPIYSPILGRASQPLFSNLAWVSLATEQFYLNGPLIIYCLPPREVIEANCREDESNNWVVPHVEAIHEAYVARAATDIALRPQHTAIYDYTRDGREHNPIATFYPWLDAMFSRKDREIP